MALGLPLSQEMDEMDESKMNTIVFLCCGDIAK